MEGHPLCPRGFSGDSAGLDNILKEGKKKRITYWRSSSHGKEDALSWYYRQEPRRPYANESSSPSHRSYDDPLKENWGSWSNKRRRK